MLRFSIGRLLLVVSMLAFGGCISMPNWMRHIGDDPADVDPKYTAPSIRKERFRHLRENMSDLSPVKREELARRLTGEFNIERDILIRAEIVRVAGDCQAEQSNRLLEMASSDPDPGVRLAACEGWSRRHTEPSVEQLSRLASGDLDIDVRLRAVQALGETGRQSAVEALRAGLDSQDPAIQYKCMEALAAVTKQDFGKSVIRWKQYVDGQTPDPPREMSITEQIGAMFSF